MKHIIYILTMLLICTGLKAQQPIRDRLEAYKIAYITKELSLTPDEAKTFWPLYDQMQAERDVLRQKEKLDRMEAKLNFDSMSDDEAAVLIDKMLDNKQTEIDILRKYNSEFQKIIPVTKVARLFRAEIEFKKHLLKEIQDRRGGGGPGGPGGGHRGHGGRF